MVLFLRRNGYETDFLAGANMQIEIVDHGARRVWSGAIGEAHPFEAYVAARDSQRLRIGAVEHRGRPASVVMPSCTVPICSNNEAISHMTSVKFH